ncbi:hypothetical protein EBR03_06080 [bacterium]|nr:hypothetical protein [bacterium]
MKKRDAGPYEFQGKIYLTKQDLLKAQSKVRQHEKWLKKNPIQYTPFQLWLVTFCEEKEIDLSEPVIAGDNTQLQIGDVLTCIMSAPTHEQEQIKKTLVLIDFKNGNVLDYLSHLAKALSKDDKTLLSD